MLYYTLFNLSSILLMQVNLRVAVVVINQDIYSKFLTSGAYIVLSAQKVKL